MLIWLKDKWEYVAALLGIAAVFLLGRRGKNAADRKTDLKEKEIDIVKQASEKELAATKAAGEKHVREIKNIHADAELKLKQAEENRDDLVQELLNNPDAIDEKIKDLGIKEV